MGRDFPEMKIRALKPLNRGKTSNIQHRTPNAEVSEDSRCHSMFGVGCSMLDVRCFPRFRGLNSRIFISRNPLPARDERSEGHLPLNCSNAAVAQFRQPGTASYLR